MFFVFTGENDSHDLINSVEEMVNYFNEKLDPLYFWLHVHYFKESSLSDQAIKKILISQNFNINPHFSICKTIRSKFLNSAKPNIYIFCNDEDYFFDFCNQAFVFLVKNEYMKPEELGINVPFIPKKYYMMLLNKLKYIVSEKDIFFLIMSLDIDFRCITPKKSKFLKILKLVTILK